MLSPRGPRRRQATLPKGPPKNGPRRRQAIPRGLGPNAGSWYHRPTVLRRVLPLALLPLLSACPSFAYGPDAYELYELDPEVCAAAELDTPCSYFELANGPELFTDPAPQPLVLLFGFESYNRNLDHVTLVYERPDAPPSQLVCPFGYVLEGVSASGISCESVGLLGFVPEEADERTPTPQDAAEGVMEIQTLVDARQPGPHAISVWLTDDNELESQVLRWQFTMREPMRDPATMGDATDATDAME